MRFRKALEMLQEVIDMTGKEVVVRKVWFRSKAGQEKLHWEMTIDGRREYVGKTPAELVEAVHRGG